MGQFRKWKRRGVGCGAGVVVLMGIFLSGSSACASPWDPASRAASRPAVHRGSPPPGLRGVFYWKTDWSRSSIDLSELRSGGPPRDGIPPIDHPEFEKRAEDSRWSDEPVIVLELNGDARAYPLRILLWHEMVNDVVGGVPVTVTFCPLCHSAIVFDRRVGDRVLSFGVSGLLRKSDMVMWDRQTESLWQQFTGRGIVGEMTGVQLRIIPSRIISRGEFVRKYPRGKVLAPPSEVLRPYGRNPYVNYAEKDRKPFLYRGRIDNRYAPMERVTGIIRGDDVRVYPMSRVAREGRIVDVVGGETVVLTYHPNVLSVLDKRNIRDSRRDGSVEVTDEQGNPVPHLDTFWFAWQAFHPER